MKNIVSKLTAKPRLNGGAWYIEIQSLAVLRLHGFAWIRVRLPSGIMWPRL